MIRNIILAATALTAVVAMAAPAAAVTGTVTNSPFNVPPNASGTFGRTVSGNGQFTDFWDFSLTAANGADISSSATNSKLRSTQIKFNTVELYNGSASSLGSLVKAYTVGFNTLLNQNYAVLNLGNDSLVLGTGPYTIKVLGTLSNGPSSYTGEVNLAGAVPEPATWGLMIVGFGLVGGSLRSRRRSVVAA